jgi:hypothetical protein
MRGDHEGSELIAAPHAVAEIRGRLGHALVVGNYYSEVLTQPSGTGEMDGRGSPESVDTLT